MLNSLGHLCGSWVYVIQCCQHTHHLFKKFITPTIYCFLGLRSKNAGFMVSKRISFLQRNMCLKIHAVEANFMQLELRYYLFYSLSQQAHWFQIKWNDFAIFLPIFPVRMHNVILICLNLLRKLQFIVYSLIDRRQLHIFFTQAKTWHRIVWWFSWISLNYPVFAWFDHKIVLLKSSSWSLLKVAPRWC